MSWYPDLGTVTMVDEGAHVRVVGWLAANQNFPTGEVSKVFSERLRDFANRWRESSEALGWGSFRGLHRCELCGQLQAYGNLGVPAGELLYVGPEMIVHYVEVHRYHPPEAFIAAAMSSSLPDTNEYRTAVTPFKKLHELFLKEKYEIL